MYKTSGQVNPIVAAADLELTEEDISQVEAKNAA
jgi:hypothetical protein